MKPYKVPPHSRKGLLRTCRRAFILCLVAMVLAAASVVLPWYLMGFDPGPPPPPTCHGMCWEASLNATHFYLFGECYVVNPATSYDMGSVTSCVGFPGEPNTGRLYAAVAGLVISGVVLGVVATRLGLQLAWTRRPKKIAVVRLAPWLVIVSGVLLLAAPLILLVGQPSVFTMDTVTFGCSPLGPAQSFWGACGEPTVSTGGNVWGPDLGWFFSIGAAAAMFIGGMLFHRFGKSLLLHGQIVAAEGSDMKRLKQSIDLPPDVT